MFGECVDAPVTNSRHNRRSGATMQAVLKQPAPAPTIGEQAAQLAAQTGIDLSLIQKVPSTLLQGLNPGMLRRAMINAAAAISDGKKLDECDGYADGDYIGPSLQSALANSITMLPLASRLPLLNKWSPSALAVAAMSGPVIKVTKDTPASFYDFGPAAEKAKADAAAQRAKLKATKAKRRERGLEAAFAAVNEITVEEQPSIIAAAGRMPPVDDVGSKRRRVEARMFLEEARQVGPGDWEEIAPAKREQDAKKAALDVLGTLERNQAAAAETSRVSRTVGKPVAAADGKQNDGWETAPAAKMFTESGTAVARDGGRSSKSSREAWKDGAPSWVFRRSRSRSGDRDRDRGVRHRSGGDRRDSPPRDVDRAGGARRGSSLPRDGERTRRRAARMRDDSRSPGPGPGRGDERRRTTEGRIAEGRTTEGPSFSSKGPAAAPESAAKPGSNLQPEPAANPDAFLRQLGVRNGWAEFVNERTGEKVFKNVRTGERTNRMPTEYRSTITNVMNQRRLAWLAGQRGGGQQQPHGLQQPGSIQQPHGLVPHALQGMPGMPGMQQGMQVMHGMRLPPGSSMPGMSGGFRLPGM